MILENSVADTLLVGTSEADSILNLADDVTINSGDGDDTVYSGLEGQAANRALINLGSGNNQATIQGGSDKVSVIAGDGNNVIQTTSPNNLLQSGSGNDSLCCYTGSDNNTMISGDGDDVIDAVGHNVTINAGSGNDTIQTYRNAYDISINAGTGDDVITLRGPVDTDHTNLVQYAEGDGNDTITNFSETDSLQITSGTISNAKLVGNNVVVTVGSGTITLIEANNMNINLVDAEGNLTQTIFSGGTLPPEVPGNTLIAGTSGDDYLSNAGGKNVTINGLGGNDTIVNALVDKKVNTGNYSVINAGEGDNKVSIAGSAYVTVNTGDGSNTICSDSNGMDNVIYLGNGKNSVITSNRRSSIIGGAGGNGITLHNGSFNSYVEAGDGNDTVAVGHYEITVKGGDGDDVINLFRDAEDSFIIPGKGNDKITVYNNKHSQTYQYTQGDGDDTVTGFGADDTLKVVGVSSVSSVVKDGNLVLDFGDGSFTFAGVSAAASLNVEYIAKWSTLEGGAYKFTSPAQNYFPTSTAQKFADFTLSGGNLKDGDGDEIPDGVSIGAVRYVPQSGVHTNINHLSGNVVYNGDSLGVEGDEDYAIEAISPIDLSEKFPNDVYIIDPNVTAIRGVSDKATVSPRGTAGTSTAADWISIDSTDSKVTFLDGTYCVYTENKFSTRDYTKLSISNNNAGVEISASEDLIKTIGNLQDGYEITIESGINVGEKIDFKTSGAGVIVVKTTANSGKYSLDADSDEWQYQHFTLGSDDEFTFVFGENGSVVGVEGFDANLQTDDNSLFKAEWVTLSGGGFEYTGNAKNNPSKWVTFTVSGASITSTDNLTVTNNMYIPSMGGNRIAINGLNGNAFIDDNELGIGGDSNYAAHFTKSADDINNSNIVVLNISDGATVDNNYSAGTDDDGQINFADGLHTVFTNEHTSTHDFTSINADNNKEGFSLNVNDGTFDEISGLNTGFAVSVTTGGNIGDELAFKTDGGKGTVAIQYGDTSAKFNVSGDSAFGVKFNYEDNSVELVDYDGWQPVSDGVYKYASDKTNFTISGEDFDPNVAKVTFNVYLPPLNSNRIEILGLNGNATINGVETGIYNDKNYGIHAQVSADSPDIEMLTATNVSDGASIGNAANGVRIEDDAEVNFADGTYQLEKKKHKSSQEFATITVDNGGAGFNVKVVDDAVKTLGGLVDGFNVTLKPSVTVGDELTIKTDGKSGTLNVSETTLEVDGDKKFSILLNDERNITGLKNFDGNSTITGGGDLAVIEDTGAKVSITASKGNDIIVSDGENVFVDLKGGKTDLFVTGGKMTLEGYDASTGTGFGTDYDDVLEAFKNGEFDFGKGKLTINSAVVDFGKDSELINIFDVNGNLQKVGFVSDDDSLNTANEKADLILVGEKGSTLTGGKGNDSIYADDGAIVDGGAGKNYIYLNAEDNEGTTIALSGGKNTVDNFNATFDDGDKVSVDATTADFKFDGTDLNIKSGGKAVLQGISSEDGAARILTVADGKEIKTAIAQKGSIIAVNDNNEADIYIGNKSGVDFTNFEESLVVDLTDGKSFRGINQVMVGGGLNTLIASSANETLTSNSEGITEFVFDKGNGRDVIKNFNFDEDKINVGTNAITNVLLTKVGNVRMQIGDSEDWLTIEDAQGKSFKINGFTAKVDSNIEYDDEANYFVASSRNATVTVSDEAEIWLDGSHGKTFIGDIKTLDATNSDGKNILAGNNLDNTILAGKGDASLWGGNGGDDLLIGGEGQNMFFYTLGNGNDSISGTKSGDIVYLSAVTLENLAGSEFNGNSVAINFKDGGKLTVNDAENCSFIMGDQTYYVDSEHSGFVTEK